MTSGFTLVELLIVIIIVAILAAMIVPRFLAQPERAVVAEANTMLGALSRAENTYIDSGVGTTWVAVGAGTGWTTIGMVEPAASPNWTYACTAATNCTATRKDNGGDYKGAIISVDTAGSWNCASKAGASKSYVASSSGGCQT